MKLDSFTIILYRYQALLFQVYFYLEIFFRRFFFKARKYAFYCVVKMGKNSFPCVIEKSVIFTKKLYLMEVC